MATEMDLAERVMSVIQDEVAKRCKKAEEDREREMKLRVESDRRAAKFEKECKKMRAKLRRLKRRSVGITKPAKTQRERMVSEAGSEAAARAASESGTAELQQQEEEGTTQQQQTTTKKKTKIVRLSQRACSIVMARPMPTYPRIPSWRLAMQPESTQELYKRSVAAHETLERIYENRRAQVCRNGYIEVEVPDDGDDDMEA